MFAQISVTERHEIVGGQNIACGKDHEALKSRENKSFSTMT